ncbi:Light-harvesting complex stress-related protein 3.2, chloroplastic [Dirofilaria immitis]
MDGQMTNRAVLMTTTCCCDICSKWHCVDKQVEASSDTSFIEMSVKDTARQMFIGMKTKIISYGPHNGIVVHCGIQQGPEMFWPCILNDTAKSLSSRQFDVAPDVINWSTVEDSDDNLRKKKASYISNQLYPLNVEDKTLSDNFNTSKKIRFNVIETNPVIAEHRSFDMESVLGGSIKLDSVDTVSKISNDDATSAKRLLTTDNVDSPYRSTANGKEIIKKEALIQNIRFPSLVHSRRDGQHVSTTQINSNFSSMKQSFKIGASCGHYNDPSDEHANEMEIEISEQFLSSISPSDVSKKSLSTDFDENSSNSKENFSLSLTPENFSFESKVRDGNHMELLVEYPQQCSQSSTNIFSDTDILRHSLYVQSVIPTSLKKVQESVAHKKSVEIKKPNIISTDEMKNFKKISSEHLKVLQIKKSSTVNYGQLEMTAKQALQRQELTEKEENFENILQKLKNRNKKIGENAALEEIDKIRSAITVPLKSILHISSRKSDLTREVRFPAEEPQVIALEHRLLIIDDLNLV